VSRMMVWDTEMKVMSWNANGMLTLVRQGGEVVQDVGKGGRQRWWYLASALRRWGADVIGIQETRLRGWGWVERMKDTWKKKGYESVWTIESGHERGIAMLWRSSKFSLKNVVCYGPRLLNATLTGASGDFGVWVGHAPNDPGERADWYRILQRAEMGAREISLFDHNSIIAPGVDSENIAVEGWGVGLARETELSVINGRGWADAWIASGESGGGFTRGGRRIDRIHVSKDFEEAVGECNVVPIGWSDHKAVILTVRPPVVTGKRWKVPEDFWSDERWVKELGSRLESVRSKGWEWWTDAEAAVRDVVMRWQRMRPWPAEIENGRGVLREVRGGNLEAGQAWLRLRGASNFSNSSDDMERMVRKEVELMKRGVVRAKLEERIGKGSIGEAYRTVRELGRVNRPVIVNDGVDVVKEPVRVAEMVRQYWDGVRVPGIRSIVEVREWLRDSVPHAWWNVGRVGRRNIDEDVVKEALNRLKGSSSPGWDGIPARCFQMYDSIFIPKMVEVVGLVESGMELPENWKVALCVHIPKEGGGRSVSDMRPISVQGCAMRWLTTILLVSMESVVKAVVPKFQAAFVKGRRMEDHVRQVEEWWREGGDDAFVAVDFSKAYDSVSFEVVEAIMEMLGVPLMWRRMYMDVLRGPVWFVFNGVVVQEVVYKPMAGIRQGDAWSPALFSVVMTVLGMQMRKLGIGDRVLMFADDVLVVLPSRDVEKAELFKRLMDEWAAWTGLQLNQRKTVVVVRGDEHCQSWMGWSAVKRVKYLGATIGHGGESEKWTHVLEKFWGRVRALERLGCSREAKAWLVNMWCLPVLRLQAYAGFVSDSLLRELDRGVRVAMHVRSWEIPTKIMYLGKDKGGLGLWSPKVYLHTVNACGFAEWVAGKEGCVGSEGLKRWLSARGIGMSRQLLRWIHLSRVNWEGTPLMGDGLRSVVALRKVATGAVVKEGDLETLPIWNSWGVRRDTGSILKPSRRANQTIVVADVVRDGAVAARPHFLVVARDRRARCVSAVQAVVNGCHENGVFTYRGDTLVPWSEWRVGSMMRQASNWEWYESRQSLEVWKSFLDWPGKGCLREFVWVALWKKTPVRKRLFACKLVEDSQCVWGDGEEDWLHIVKGCERLRWWFHLLQGMFGDVGNVELSRLVVDAPLASLQTAQGALVWAGVWMAWGERCDVAFGRDRHRSGGWGWRLGEFIRGWRGMEQLGLVDEVRESVANGIERWLERGVMSARIVVPLRPWRRRREKRRRAVE
jgi:hypothetical protein